MEGIGNRSISAMPLEVIEHILLQGDLSAKDLSAVAGSSVDLHGLVHRVWNAQGLELPRRETALSGRTTFLQFAKRAEKLTRSMRDTDRDLYLTLGRCALLQRSVGRFAVRVPERDLVTRGTATVLYSAEPCCDGQALTLRDGFTGEFVKFALPDSARGSWRILDAAVCEKSRYLLCGCGDTIFCLTSRGGALSIPKTAAEGVLSGAAILKVGGRVVVIVSRQGADRPCVEVVDVQDGTCLFRLARDSVEQPMGSSLVRPSRFALFRGDRGTECLTLWSELGRFIDYWWLCNDTVTSHGRVSHIQAMPLAWEGVGLVVCSDAFKRGGRVRRGMLDVVRLDPCLGTKRLGKVRLASMAGEGARLGRVRSCAAAAFQGALYLFAADYNEFGIYRVRCSASGDLRVEADERVWRSNRLPVAWGRTMQWIQIGQSLVFVVAGQTESTKEGWVRHYLVTEPERDRLLLRRFPLGSVRVGSLLPVRRKGVAHLVVGLLGPQQDRIFSYKQIAKIRARRENPRSAKRARRHPPQQVGTVRKTESVATSTVCLSTDSSIG